MKKILIDLGSHNYEGLTKLINDNIINSDFEVYCYEPNPNVYKDKLINLSFKQFKTYNEAVCDFDGSIILNIDETKISQGCNTLPTPPAEDILWKTKYKWDSIEVPCVSMDTVLERCNIKEKDELYIKCDIEGSEFDVLNMLLKSPYIFNIKNIFVEWHDRFWYPNEKHKQQEKEQIINMFKILNIKIEEWQ